MSRIFRLPKKLDQESAVEGIGGVTLPQAVEKVQQGRVLGAMGEQLFHGPCPLFGIEQELLDQAAPSELIQLLGWSPMADRGLPHGQRRSLLSRYANWTPP